MCMFEGRAGEQCVGRWSADALWGKLHTVMTNPRARAVVSKMGVISVLHTLKFDTQCLLESHLSTPAHIHKMHTHAYMHRILNTHETTWRGQNDLGEQFLK